MRMIAIWTMAVLLQGACVPGAWAESSSGSVALALAALVGAHAPGLPPRDKRALAAMLGGRLSFAFPRGRTIAVAAEGVTCRSSDVDISTHACTLAFGAATRMLAGRTAHELDATLAENGVASDGAAGSIFLALTHLACTIGPAAVKQRDGGGADCTWDP